MSNPKHTFGNISPMVDVTMVSANKAEVHVRGRDGVMKFLGHVFRNDWKYWVGPNGKRFYSDPVCAGVELLVPPPDIAAIRSLEKAQETWKARRLMKAAAARDQQPTIPHNSPL